MKREKHASYSSHNSCKSLSEELRDYYEGRHRSHLRPHSRREAEEGFQGSEGEGIKRREKKEEERRANEAKTQPNRNRNHSLRHFLVLCSSCDRRLILFLKFECDLCTLRGLPCYYVHIHLPHLSSAISFFFVKFNLNRSLVS